MVAALSYKDSKEAVRWFVVRAQMRGVTRKEIAKGMDVRSNYLSMLLSDQYENRIAHTLIRKFAVATGMDQGEMLRLSWFRIRELDGKKGEIDASLISEMALVLARRKPVSTA